MGVEDSFFGSGSQELRESSAYSKNNNKYDADDDVSTTAQSITTYLRPWVRCSKATVFVALISSAALVGYFAWFVLSEDEQDGFRTQFRSDARRVLSTAVQRGLDAQAAMTTFSGIVASFAQYGDAVFPNFTMPDFEAFAEQTKNTTGIQQLLYAPWVTDAKRVGWEAYAVEHAEDWLSQSRALVGINPSDDENNNIVVPYIHRPPDGREDASSALYYLPVWQISPPPVDPTVINLNLLHYEEVQRLVELATVTGHPAWSQVLSENVLSHLTQYTGREENEEKSYPQSMLIVPVRSTWDNGVNDKQQQEGEIVGHVVAILPWQALMINMLQQGRGPVHAVMRNSCGTVFTYHLDGRTTTFLGLGDFHDIQYNHLVEKSEMMSYQGDLTEIGIVEDPCQYTMEVYPSSEMEDDFTTNQPIIFMISVVGVFVFAALLFIMYDKLMQRQQRQTMSTALRATSIVRSLFPHNVAEELQAQKAEEQREQRRQQRNKRRGFARTWSKESTDEAWEKANKSEELMESKPMAELFPSATVLFADIAGFTAWSSSREPEQVFVLLENLYQAFDKIATKRRVFKVETIGDCYVAVCGLPNPDQKHAITMCRFAVEICEKFKEQRCKLEVRLGPDTGDLSIRIGMHSGPVTAGVLRGERARFQLFGDTVNTASRMESNGEPDRIHMSLDTAAHLREAGKEHWFTLRRDKITVKGKGDMETYWLLTREKATGPKGSSEETNDETQNGTEHNKDDLLVSSAPVPELVVRNEKFQRMIDWNSDILLQLLRAVVGARSSGYRPRRSSKQSSLERLEIEMGQDSVPYEEVGEPPALPPDFVGVSTDISALENTEVDPVIAQQLHEYVTVIASMYRDNAFHNFEHASHVSMSAVKLLSRVVGPISKRRQGVGSGSDDSVEFAPGENSYGITSDPLTQFTVVLAALIHDVDHRGVPNEALSREEPSLASAYKNKSLAEQNSFDVAWRVLMGEDFKDLRYAIYTSPAELRRFRQILVNVVLATDLFDRDMSRDREERWGSAFVPRGGEEGGGGGIRDSVHSGVSVRDSIASTVTVHYFRANVVLEYMIQASDVAHTMQHWHVYKKWNERLFRETYQAFRAGRITTDPTDTWYDGEMSFFDDYVIPLAKRLKESEAFGVSSDEYLNYAEKNRVEWQTRGRDVVTAFRANVDGKSPARARRRSSGYGR